MSDIDITKAIIEAVQATLHEKEMTKIAVDMDSPLNEELGLDSLDCAVVIIRLEEVLDVDPFQDGVSAKLVSIADLVTLYTSHLSAG